MRKWTGMIVFSILAIGLVGYSIAALNAQTDLALKAVTVGTYDFPKIATDGIESAKKSVATSNVVADNDQYLIVDLGKLVYIDRVKVLWDLKAYPRDFEVRTSTDGKYWADEAVGLDAGTGASDTATGTIALNISCSRAVIGARYVQIKVPAGSGVSSGDRVKIAEVEVSAASGQKLSLLEGTTSYVVTDRSAVIAYKTSIGTAGGKVLYGTDPNSLTNVAPNQQNGVDNSATLYGLRPGTGYYYKIQSTDLNGNLVESDVRVFATLNNNLAYNKPVEGTFTELPPSDPFVDKVKPVLPRITTNSTSYFTSTATSRSIADSDQYVTIDLGRSYPIKSIQAYWRKLAYPESYSVMVSSDNAAWTVVADNVNAADGVFSRSDTGDPMQVVSTPANGATARFVKIFIKQGSPFFHKHADWNFVQLMGVRVFSD